MANQVYSDPQYVLPNPAKIILSETRPVRLDPPALQACNYLLDELLHLWIHSAVSGPLSPALNGAVSPTSVPAIPTLLTPGPLGPNEILTTDRFKSGVIRVIGPQLGKNAVLEAELAVRELLRLGAPSLRGDAALRKASFGSASRHGSIAGAEGVLHGQADDMFGSLRAYVQLISGMGEACPPTGPATVSGHLVALSPPPSAPHPASPHISFILALYAERCLSFVADYVIRAIGRCVERESRKEAGGLKELEAAIGEDEAIWNWVRGMRVRTFIEGEVVASRARSSGSNQGHGTTPMTSPNGARRTVQQQAAAPQMQSRTSYDSMQSGITYGKKEREGSMGLGIMDGQNEGDFDQLMQSGRTMKVSLTPDRLRTMERFERGRNASSTSLNGSTSLPSLSAANSPGGSSAGSKRLTARGARKQDQIDEDDELDDFGTRRRPKESLMELLSSPPPWPTGSDGPTKFSSNSNASPAMSSGSTRSRKMSLKRSTHNDNLYDASQPQSAMMVQQDSQNSFQSADSMLSSGSELGTSPKPMQRQIRPKDERKDLAQERQIQYDLQDFFANAPPPLPPLDDIFKEEDEKAATIARKASKTGGLRGFMSKVTGNKAREEEEFRHGRKDSASRLNGSFSRSSTSKAGQMSPQMLGGKYRERDIPSPNSLTVSPPYYSPLEASPPLPPLPPHTPPASSPYSRARDQTPPPPVPSHSPATQDITPPSSPEVRPPYQQGSPKTSRKAVPILTPDPASPDPETPEQMQMESIMTPPVAPLRSPPRALVTPSPPPAEPSPPTMSEKSVPREESRPEPVRLGSFSNTGPAMFISPFATDERNRKAAEEKRAAEEQAAREVEMRELEEQQRAEEEERQRVLAEEAAVRAAEQDRLQAEASAAAMRTPLLMHTAPTPPQSAKSFSPTAFYANSDAGCQMGSPAQSPVQSPVIGSPQSPALAGAINSPTLSASSPSPQSPDSTYSPSTTYSPIQIAAVTGVAGMGAAATAAFFGHRVGPVESPDLPSGLPLSSPESDGESEKFSDREEVESEKEEEVVPPVSQTRRISNASISLGSAGDALAGGEPIELPTVEVLASPTANSPKPISIKPSSPKAVSIKSASPKSVPPTSPPVPIVVSSETPIASPTLEEEVPESDVEEDEVLDEEALQTTAPLSLGKRSAPPSATPSPLIFETPASSPSPQSPVLDATSAPEQAEALEERVEVAPGTTLVELHARMAKAKNVAECVALMDLYLEQQPATLPPALPTSPALVLVNGNGTSAPEMHDVAVGSPLLDDTPKMHDAAVGSPLLGVETEERGVQSEPETLPSKSLVDATAQTLPIEVKEAPKTNGIGAIATVPAAAAAVASGLVGLVAGEHLLSPKDQKASATDETPVEEKEVEEVSATSASKNHLEIPGQQEDDDEDADEVASLAEYLLGDYQHAGTKQQHHLSVDSAFSQEEHEDVFVDTEAA